ncbi:hypothetical protein DVH24_008054 [Malus domestica]|uniref:Uncharacterized protein n=1 Tax=Malus domestica TaxID=3750 RepID=A0A498JNY1_MALDO|nr:hypothetical protein DVH24_008054 [Malus domestica]
MLKSARWRTDKNKIKEVLKLQFHATQVTQLGVDALLDEGINRTTQFAVLNHRASFGSDFTLSGSDSELESHIKSFEAELEKHAQELESNIRSLEEELEKQAQIFEADLEAVAGAKVEHEQRAIRAEEAPRKTGSKNANTAEMLREEFQRLYVRMALIFDANEKVALKANDRSQ